MHILIWSIFTHPAPIVLLAYLQNIQGMGHQGMGNSSPTCKESGKKPRTMAYGEIVYPSIEVLENALCRLLQTCSMPQAPSQPVRMQEAGQMPISVKVSVQVGRAIASYSK
jgi:hypothetical protein